MNGRREIGAQAEAAVVRYVEARGFDVVATNLHVGHLELDVIARQGPLIVVIEVRTRGAKAWTRGLGSIDTGKRHRVRRAGERLWQRRYRHDPSAERLRFDAASVELRADGSARVEYVVAAF